MSRKTTHAVTTSSPVKEASTSAVITLGAESAAKLGVPVGSQVDLGRIAYYHRNPIKRWLGQRKTSGGFDLSTPAGIEAARRAVVTAP